MGIQKIIEEKYRRADANERLCLYLEYPGLRGDFTVIEQEKVAPRTLKVPGEAVITKLLDSLFPAI